MSITEKHRIRRTISRRVSILAVWGCLSATMGMPAPAAEAVFRVGAAAIDVTPTQFPVAMVGSFQGRQATGAHDRLHARALVLDDSQSKIALVIVDNGLIPRELFDAAKTLASKTTGISPERMLMAATHTHTAPPAMPLAQLVADPEYVRQLTTQIAAAVERAANQLEPARIGWSVGKLPDEVFNRRWKMKPGSIAANPLGATTDQVMTNPPAGGANLTEPAGPTDSDLAVLSVQSKEGRPIALFANYPLHYVGDVPPQLLSADYFGEFARQISIRLNAGAASPPFVGIMSNGSSGNINNRNVREPRPRSEPFERIRLVASKAADIAYQSQQSIVHHDWVSLAMVEEEIEVGVRRPEPLEIERAKDILTKVEGSVLKSLPEIYAQETIRLSRHAPTVRLKIQAIRIGELGIAANPCEPFVEIGLEIKRKSSLQPTFIIGWANGYGGYLPTPEQHALGGYETWRSGWSFLEVNASRTITATSLQLLERVAK